MPATLVVHIHHALKFMGTKETPHRCTLHIEARLLAAMLMLTLSTHDIHHGGLLVSGTVQTSCFTLRVEDWDPAAVGMLTPSAENVHHMMLFVGFAESTE